jgi:hypothetical protein
MNLIKGVPNPSLFLFAVFALKVLEDETIVGINQGK